MTGLPPAPQILVDGKLTAASDGATYPILDPASGAEIGQAPDATAEDVDAAIAAARRAFDETAWSTDVGLRVRCLRQLHAALLADADSFKALTRAEVGMPDFMVAAAGFDAPVEGLAWVADLAESTKAPVHMARAERALLERLDTISPPELGLRPYTPDVLLEGGETLELAGVKFEVVSIPGHSPGHLAYAADGCLFSGDLLFAGGVGRVVRPGRQLRRVVEGARG